MHADRRLKHWSDGGTFSPDVRIAAVLLYPQIAHLFPSEQQVRKALGRGAALPVLEDPIPKPQFACRECEAPCHTGKEARLHCRLVERWGSSAAAKRMRM